MTEVNHAVRPSVRSRPDLALECAKRFIKDDHLKLGSDAIEPLAEVFASGEYDGYRLARRLDDRHGFDCDEDMVEALSGALALICEVEREAIKAWVQSNHIKPRFSVGHKTKTKIVRYGEVEGEIADINEDLAQYTFMIPSLGHVKDGPGCHGIILPFEHFHDICCDASDFCLTG